MKPNTGNLKTQRGAVLAVGLILLAVATLVTLTAMNTGIMQERMTANQDNNARSFMAAEAGGADLVAWLNDNPWPTSNTAPPLPGTVGGDPSITYVLNLYDPDSSWTDSKLKVLIEGRALAADNETTLARTELLVEVWDLSTIDSQEPGEPPPGGPPPVNPPAAIACFGGSCSIHAGAGQGADVDYGTVSGFNHPLPPLDCSGGNCRMQPQGEDRLMPAVPAVFLTHEAGSSVSQQGGGNFHAYQGLDRAGTGLVTGRDMTVARRATDYDTPPTWESVFPEDDFPDHNPETQLESGRTSLTDIGGSDFEQGILVVDGEDLTMRGNSLIVGLIVIRNCGSISMGGNPNVYGAIIIDATDCGPGYDPFAGNGTPAVRFSRAPLSGPPGEGSGTGPGAGDPNPDPDGRTGVKIWSEYLREQ